MRGVHSNPNTLHKIHLQHVRLSHTMRLHLHLLHPQPTPPRSSSQPLLQNTNQPWRDGTHILDYYSFLFSFFSYKHYVCFSSCCKQSLLSLIMNQPLMLTIYHPTTRLYYPLYDQNYQLYAPSLPLLHLTSTSPLHLPHFPHCMISQDLAGMRWMCRRRSTSCATTPQPLTITPSSMKRTFFIGTHILLFLPLTKHPLSSPNFFLAFLPPLSYWFF